MDEIEWPLNEPLPTDNGFWTATLLFKSDNGWYSGSLEKTEGGKCAGLWNSSGRGIGGCANLIPPKPKVRTMNVWADFENNVVFRCDSDEAEKEIDHWTKHTIAHPDDVKPITLESIQKALSIEGYITSTYAQSKRLNNLIALLKEHGIECEGGE